MFPTPVVEGPRSRHGSRAAIHRSVRTADESVQRVHLRVPVVLDTSCLSSQHLQVGRSRRTDAIDSACL